MTRPADVGPGPATLRSGYFDAMYQAANDPWGFQERWY